MLVNTDIEIKSFYRFVEFTSKMLSVDLPHERFKLIALDNFKAESKDEREVKNLAEAYLYLINNKNQSLTTMIIKKAYYLLTALSLEETVCKEILEVFYRYYDETPHYLSALIHLAVLAKVKERSIEFAFMLSNLTMLKKQRHPFIPYEFMFGAYFKTIEAKNLDKLMYIFAEIEVNSKPHSSPKELTQSQIIDKIKACKGVLQGKYNVKNLYLYGSYAKQKTSSTSDVDFLISYQRELLNFERARNNEELIGYLSHTIGLDVDLLDFTHALNHLDIAEMENIITLI